MSDTPPRTRLTLRDLPLPAKLVVSAFLLAVGLGYFSAMIQLHIAHSDQEGNPLPTPDDVVKRFSYFEKYDPNKEPQSHVEHLISGHREDGWGASNMTPAFFGKSSGYEPYSKMKPTDPKRKAVDDARESERLALIHFIKEDPVKRRAAYDKNEMPFPDALKSRPLTDAYVLGDRSGGPPKSLIEKLITGAREGGLTKTNMTPAFFSGSAYEKEVKKKGKEKVDAARETERLAFLAFIHSPKEKRKALYEADAMEMPANLKGKAIADDFVENDKLKIKTLIDDRCVRCHSDGDQAPPLDTFDKLEPHITLQEPRAPAIKITSIINDRCGRCHNENQAPQFPTYEKLEPFITPSHEEPRKALGQDWIASSHTMGTSKLVQSTHAHALSFAMLFALTGFVYAFTSHHGFARGILAPLALVAQVADLSCWWLARLDLPYGPVFALAIMGTGGVVGLSVMLQIMLSLFNMYGIKGKLVLLVMFLVAAGGFGVLFTQKLKPDLDREKERALLMKQVKEEAAPPEPPTKDEKPNGGRVVPVIPPGGAGGPGGGKKVP
jgi:hypothetical protein